MDDMTLFCIIIYIYVDIFLQIDDDEIDLFSFEMATCTTLDGQDFPVTALKRVVQCRYQTSALQVSDLISDYQEKSLFSKFENDHQNESLGGIGYNRACSHRFDLCSPCCEARPPWKSKQSGCKR